MVEVDTRLRADPALQAAFGRSACAEQSVVQQTLDACTDENVTQMQEALDQIFRQHSRAYGHDYGRTYQILDVDMSGMPCGPKAALATKGYFANERNRRGRQLGQVVASRSGEVVTDRLYDGKTQLTKALEPLVLAAEQTLQLDESKRARTIVRMDAGGGSLDDVNWLLLRGYLVHTKDSWANQRRNSPRRSQSGSMTQRPRAPIRLGHRASTLLPASGDPHCGALSQGQRQVESGGADLGPDPQRRLGFDGKARVCCFRPKPASCTPMSPFTTNGEEASKPP